MKEKIINFGYKILNSKYISKFFNSYRIIWELAGITKGTAMDAVLYNIGNESRFYSSGKSQVDELKNFIDRNSVVLDVGCGMGRIEKSLAEYCKEIHGVDISGRILRFAKSNLKEHKNVYFHRNNGKDLSAFSNDKFDFIFSILVLQHLEKEDAYLYMKEIHRVLKPDGKAYLQFPNLLSDEVFRWFIDYAKTGSRHIARVRGYTVPEIDKMMSSAGFEDLKISVEGSSIICTGLKTNKV